VSAGDCPGRGLRSDPESAAKSAEERYQTAAGLERDPALPCCMGGSAPDRRLPAGEQDTPDRLLIPQKLYGESARSIPCSPRRPRHHSASRSWSTLRLSGIGKSAVVNELHKALVPPRGLFASGKFDQYKRDIPYTTLGQPSRALSARS